MISFSTLLLTFQSITFIENSITDFSIANNITANNGETNNEFYFDLILHILLTTC